MNKELYVNFVLSLSLCMVLLLPGCVINIGDASKAKYERTVHLSAPLQGVTKLDAQTNIGSITVKSADVADCDVIALITVKASTEEKARELGERVEIVAKVSDDKLTIKALKPVALPASNLTVDLTIFATKQLNLDCSANVGTIRISDFDGQITAATDVGSIFCEEIRAGLSVRANVGSMEVRYADDAPAACNAEVTTNVGNIEFEGPAKISAKLSASTNVGSIETARPLTVVGAIGRSVETTIGEAQGNITLRTNVGSIRIK